MFFGRGINDSTEGEVDTEEDCEFCEEFSKPESGFTGMSGGSLNNRVVCSEGPLYVIPSLGEIVQGHLLIVPHYHVTAMTSLDASHRSPTLNLIRHICERFLTKHQNYPIFFEHGDPTGSQESYGQCVSHAHLHVLPKRVNMLPQLAAELRSLGRSQPGEFFADINEPYVSFADGADLTTHYFAAKDAPRQYMRKLYCDLIGKPGAENWYSRINMSETEKSSTIYRKLLSFENST